MKQGLLIMLEECGQNNTVYWSIILRKKHPAQQHSGSTHLIERLDKWAVHSPAQLWFGVAQEWVWRPSAE